MSEIYAIPELREVLPAGAVPRHALFQLSSESKRQVRASTVVWHRPAPAVYRYMYVYPVRGLLSGYVTPPGAHARAARRLFVYGDYHNVLVTWRMAVLEYTQPTAEARRKTRRKRRPKRTGVPRRARSQRTQLTQPQCTGLHKSCSSLLRMPSHDTVTCRAP